MKNNYGKFVGILRKKQVILRRHRRFEPAKPKRFRDMSTSVSSAITRSARNKEYVARSDETKKFSDRHSDSAPTANNSAAANCGIRLPNNNQKSIHIAPAKQNLRFNTREDCKNKFFERRISIRETCEKNLFLQSEQPTVLFCGCYSFYCREILRFCPESEKRL